MPNGANYVSESFWDLKTFTTLFLWLVMLVTMCLPAITAYRHRDKKQMWISLACGITGMVLLIPWIVSVIMVIKKYRFPQKSGGAIKPLVFTAHGVALILLGTVVLISNRASGISHGTGLVIYGAGVLISSLLPGKAYWGGLMIMSSLLVSSVDMELFELPLYLVYEVLALIGVGLVVCNVLKTELSLSTAEKVLSTDTNALSTKASTLSTAGKNLAEQLVFGAKEVKNKVAEKTSYIANLKEDKNSESKGEIGKMKLVRCPNGHFYDGEQYKDDCPYCIKANEPVVEEKAPTEAPVQAVFEEKPAFAAAAPVAFEEKPSAFEEPVSSAKPEEPPQAVAEQPQKPNETAPAAEVATSVTAAPKRHKRPVVGWLVCIKGVYKGESFILNEGRNFIGRSEEMDVRLEEDDSIAQSKQAAVIYEPKSRKFILSPGDVHELCYVNGEVALSATTMEAYDTLDMGNTGMLLIPCCGKRFSWEEGLSKE